MQGKTLIDPQLSMPREEVEDCLTAYLQQEGRSNPRECAERWLKDLLKYHLIQPVIQPNLEEHIEFRHQLIQEYYAAEYLLQLLQPPNGKPGLTDEELKRDYLNYLKWTEPVALMLALVNDKKQALRVVKLAIYDVDLMLGASLAGKVKSEFQTIAIGWINDLKLPKLLKLQCLTITKSKAAIPLLLPALGHPNSEIRQSAVMALGDLGSKESIPGLLLALNDSEQPEVRRTAAVTLRKFYTEKLISKLLSEFENFNKKPIARWRADEMLKNLGSEAAIPGLIVMLETSNQSEVRRTAAEVLGDLGSEAAIPHLHAALKDLECEVCWSAASALRKLDNKDVIKNILREFESDLDPYSRFKVTVALAKLGSKQAIPELLIALEDPEFAFHATEALGELSDKVATPGLLNVLKTGNIYVRESAAEALGKIGSAEAIPGLLNALQDSEYNVRHVAAWSLGEIGRIEAVASLLKALNDWNIYVRGSVAEALGKIGSAEAIPGLLNALQDSEYEVRCRVAEALGRIGGIAVVSALIDIFEDPVSYVQCSAAKALGDLGAKEAISVLLHALSDSSYEVRCSVTKSLGKSGDFEVLDKLWQLQYQKPESHIGNAISAIQNRYQFYNYEIWQETVLIQNSKLERQNDGQGCVDQRVIGRTPGTPHYTVKAEVVQIIEQNHGKVIGKQSPDQK